MDRKALLLFFILLLFINSSAQDLMQLPKDFKDNAWQHVDNLAGFGVRNAGSSGEAKTVAYLKDYFSSLKLNTKIDTFSFQSYAVEEMTVTADDKKINFRNIYFNPYTNPTGVNGRGCMISSDSQMQSVARDSVCNHIVFTNESVQAHRIYKLKPIAIVVLKDSDFQKLNPSLKLCSVKVIGNLRNRQSYNIWASLNNSCKKQILIGAHWDSYNSPGADDNASGVGVALELARYFHQNKATVPFNITFVFFGAEELGLLGSKAWCEKHVKDTASVLCYLNIDCVGDTGEIIADINGGVTCKSLAVANRNNPAVRDSDDPNNRWSLDEDLLAPDESNTPSWLKDIMAATLISSHHPFTATRGIGSDHRSFANMGFISTHIGMNGENVQHCQGDKINQVNKNSLELAGRIVATVVMKTKEKQEGSSNLDK